MNLDFESLRENVLKNEVELKPANEELTNALESANEALKISGDELTNAKRDVDLALANVQGKEKSVEAELNAEKTKDTIIQESKNVENEKSVDSQKNMVQGLKNKIEETQKDEAKKQLNMTQEKEVGDKSEQKSWFTKLSEASMKGQIFSALGRVGSTLFDSLAKKFLKDKYKMNYSVYNNGKKAVVAATKKDAVTFVKKGLDAVVSAIKWIKPTTKMVIRNVKNKVVDEVFGFAKKLF